MRGVNHVFLIGNLGKDPEIQYIEGNIPVAKFPLATTETFKDKKGNTIPQTEWHNIVLWRGLAELAAKYLHKGSLVHIEGCLRTRHWEDKDKNRRFMTEIIASNMVMLDKRSNEFRSDQDIPPGMQTGEIPVDPPTLGSHTDDELPY
ncbi:MAG: single-stranded DNA-binding protein [Chitinophagaceae bacterium]|nr:single-stranded DNA-binding protein [Chitinophagaceae bacterium]